MARVKGPLMSMTASGSIAQGGLQFRQTRNGPQVVIPALGQPKRQQAATPRQSTIRAIFEAAAREWRSTSPELKQHWNAQAQGTRHASGWELFLSTRMTEAVPPRNLLITPDGAPITDGRGRRLFV